MMAADESYRSEATQAVTILAPGAMISRYRLLSRLGEGGMGAVFLAEDSGLKRQVALKFLSAQFASDQIFRTRFIREAQSAARLSHPNVVTIFEVGESQGHVFIAMEYLQGQSLRQLMDQRLPTLERTLAIMAQVGDALAAAHVSGITHRDVKPANIIVDPNDRVRLLDFGLAKSEGEEQLTQAGTALGTVSYMSPEHAMGKNIDPRSDVFSAGIVLFEMLSGQLPFKKPNIPATMHAIVNEAHPSIRALVPSLPQSLQNVVDRSLAKLPEQRYSSARQMADELRGSLFDLAGLSKGSPVPTGRTTTALPAVAAKVTSLAVLHLQNLGTDEDDALCYGITEDLIVDLTRIGSMRVSPMRAILKYKDSDADIEEIAAKLKVDLILDGSLRRSAGSIRVTAQLVEAASGTNLWADRWEHPIEKLPEIKQALANGVAQALQIGVTVVSAAFVGTPDAEDAQAYELYLRGKYAFEHKKEKADVVRALELYQQALKMEPNLLAARAGLAEALLHQGEYDRAAAELATSLDEARAKELKPDEASLLRLLCRYYVQRSDWKLAHQHASRSLELAKELNDTVGEIESIGLIIIVLQRQSKFDEALQLFDRVLSLSRQVGDQQRLAEVLKNMGQAYARRGEFDRASSMYEESLELARQQDDMSIQAACLSNLGNISFYRGKLAEAFSRYQDSLDIYNRLGDKAGSARQALNLGLIEATRGNLNSALTTLRSAETNAEQLGDKVILAMTKVNISQVLVSMGRPEDAVVAAAEAFHIAQEVTFPVGRTTSQELIGQAYLYKRDYVASEGAYQKALEEARDAALSRNECYAMIGLGIVHYYQKNIQKAREYFNSAQSIAKDLGDKSGMSRSTAYLGAITSREGLFFAGTRQIRQVVRDAELAGDSQLEVSLSILLAEVLLTCGDSPEDQSEGERLLITIEARARELSLAPELKRLGEIAALPRK